MQVQIKFIRHGANSAIGGFSPGDRARVDEAFAQHLVDSGVAVLADPAPAQAKPAPVKKAAKK